MVIHVAPSTAFADGLLNGVAIPDHAKVVPPPPRCRKASSGIWVLGSAAGAARTSTILIVESVQSDGSASVIYAWGGSPDLSITPGFARLGANLSGDTLAQQSN
jgi:hypothetical protein